MKDKVPDYIMQRMEPRAVVKWDTHGDMLNKEKWTFDAEVQWKGQWTIQAGFKTREEAKVKADDFVKYMIMEMEAVGYQHIKGLKAAKP